jgi:glucokinase
MNAVFDLGGTHLRCGVDDGDDSLQGVERIRIAGLPWDDVAASMRAYMSRAIERFGFVERIAFAFPGPIDDRGVALTAPTLGLQSVPVDLSRVFADLCDAPVHVLNDVSAAAWYLADTADDERFIVVTVSSGIGAKICDRTRKRPVFDDAPFGGEIGHLTIDFSDSAPVCDCGERGHLGAIASGRGIERHVRAAAGAAAILTNEDDIAPAVRAGDTWMLARVREATAPLGAVLATVVQSCGLQRILLIGGFARMAGAPYMALLEEEVLRRIAPARFGKPPAPLVQMPDTDDDVCLRGAAVFARAQESAACVSSS